MLRQETFVTFYEQLFAKDLAAALAEAYPGVNVYGRFLRLGNQNARGIVFGAGGPLERWTRLKNAIRDTKTGSGKTYGQNYQDALYEVWKKFEQNPAVPVPIQVLDGVPWYSDDVNQVLKDAQSYLTGGTP
jgi:hypothetical protein